MIGSWHYNVVCPSVTLCALWRSELMLTGKRTVLFLAGNFLLISLDTCCRMYRLNVYQKTQRKNEPPQLLQSGIELRQSDSKMHVAQCAATASVTGHWHRERTEITSGEK